MSATAELLSLDQPIDFTRDRWDRPLIAQPDGTTIPYTRASSAAKTIEDTYNLELWARRNVAYGLAHDPSLVARVLAVGGTPHDWTDDQKREVTAVLDSAAQIAQAHRGADIGTAVHHMTHRLDLGHPVDAGPFTADLDAYRHTLLRHGFTIHPEWVEVKLVSDELRIAGTADRIISREGVNYIADIKTGRIGYGALGWAAQLAAYAHGTLYDPAVDQRLPTPEINQEWGIIIHLPAGEGRCDLYWIDLTKGLEAARFAGEIRDLRAAAKGWMRPLEGPSDELITRLAASLPHDGPTVDPALVQSTAADLRARLRAAVEAGARRITWPDGVAKFKDGGPATWAEILKVERAVLDAEAEAGLPFHDHLPEDPSAPPAPALKVVTDPTGGGVTRPPSSARPDPGEVNHLREIHDQLPVDLQQAVLGAVATAGVPTDRRRWTQDHMPTLRRILENAATEATQRRAHVTALVTDLDDDGLVTVLLTVLGADDLEQLTAVEVRAFEALVGLYDRVVRLTVTEDGEMVLTSTPEAEAAVIAVHGSKSAALSAAKELAAHHGRPAPRSVAQAASDPVLAALLCAEAPDTSESETS